MAKMEENNKFTIIKDEVGQISSLLSFNLSYCLITSIIFNFLLQYLGSYLNQR